MHFTIDGKAYMVKIAARALFLDGDECDGKIDYTGQRILIANDIARHARRRVLFHELRHGWINARGKPRDDEADADDAAEMMDELMTQYYAQGGDAVLEALNPDPERRPSSSVGGALVFLNHQCGCCGALIAVGSIADDKPEWNADLRLWTVNRGMLCPACNRVTVWVEVCREDGMPSGSIVAFPKPRVLRGAEAGKWIERHPEECSLLGCG